ncbi:MAG: response regulator [Salinisphaera sp.]|uniref:response regulator n=1 Tax=Salinisphaera sp. TaxID=1914330 RepID=UPI003C7D7702
MRILIAEDDAKTGHLLRTGLFEAGHVVDLAADGEQALEWLFSEEYDAAILDLMLPGRDGWSVLSALRDANDHLPVLLLTARDEVSDRVHGLDLGADDYLVKPFAFSELVARLRAIARRGDQIKPERFVIGDLVVDPIRRHAARADRALHLTPKEFSLLALLAGRAGQVVSRAVIAEKIWEMTFGSDLDMNVIDVAVARLRSKVDVPFPDRLIHTVRGVGYVLELRH